MDVIVYMTVACINDWEAVMSNVYTKLRMSPLYHKVKQIRCCVHANNRGIHSHELFRDPKTCIIEMSSTSDNTFEKRTLDLLWEHSKTEDFYVLYLHSKGVSDRHQNEKARCNIKACTDYMLYYNIEYHESILDALNEYDAIGTNLNGHSNVEYSKKYAGMGDYLEKNGWTDPEGVWPYHFSGNFWWSKTSYIRQIAKCDRCYPGAEIWICNGDGGRIGRFLSMHNAHTNFYETCYDKKEYVNTGLENKYERSNILPDGARL